MKQLFYKIRQWYIYRWTKLRDDMLTKYKKEIASKIGCDFSLIEFHKVSETFMVKGKEIIEMEEFRYLKPDDKFFIGHFTVINNSKDRPSVISSFSLYQLPHCCAYMMSCNVKVEYSYRRKGVGTILNKLRVEIASRLGYSAILCTDVSKNLPQRNILARNGWKDKHILKNKRTGNTVLLSIKEINP